VIQHETQHTLIFDNNHTSEIFLFVCDTRTIENNSNDIITIEDNSNDNDYNYIQQEEAVGYLLEMFVLRNNDSHNMIKRTATTNRIMVTILSMRLLRLKSFIARAMTG